MPLETGNPPDEIDLVSFELDVTQMLDIIKAVPAQPDADTMHTAYNALVKFKPSLQKNLHISEERMNQDLKVKKWTDIFDNFKHMVITAAKEDWDSFQHQKKELLASITTFAQLMNLRHVRETVGKIYNDHIGIMVHEEATDSNNPALISDSPTHKTPKPAVQKQPENQLSPESAQKEKSPLYILIEKIEARNTTEGHIQLTFDDLDDINKELIKLLKNTPKQKQDGIGELIKKCGEYESYLNYAGLDMTDQTQQLLDQLKSL